MLETPIIVYGTEWCGDCRRTRRFLQDHQVPFTWVNIDHDAEAEQFVIKNNHGFRSVPTLVFPDGSILVEPSDRQLAQKLGPAGS